MKEYLLEKILFFGQKFSTYHAFGVEVARDGANFAFTQTTGEPASPNDILEAQASKKNGWVTVVFDPSGPYAVTSKGTSIPVTVDSGRVLIPAGQVQIGSLREVRNLPKNLPSTLFGVVLGYFLFFGNLNKKNAF